MPQRQGSDMKFNVFGMKVPVFKQVGLTENTDWMGYFDPIKKSIVIDAALKGEEYQVTIIHEFLEAVWFRNSFNLAINNETKEVIIDQISKALIENFKISIK